MFFSACGGSFESGQVRKPSLPRTELAASGIPLYGGPSGWPCFWTKPQNAADETRIDTLDLQSRGRRPFEGPGNGPMVDVVGVVAVPGVLM